MPLSRAMLAGTIVALLTGCAARQPTPRPGVPMQVADWRQMATDDDRERLRHWREAWMDGVAAARKAGKGAVLDAEGALFDPDRAIDGAVPPAGAYRCRVFKLGAKGTAMADLTVYPAARCRIDDSGAVSSFYKLDGEQRPSGVIFHDSRSRAIFLGTMSFGDETLAMDYGRDRRRDMIGFVDRVAPAQWRLVLPSPRFESMTDVVELVPEAS